LHRMKREDLSQFVSRIIKQKGITVRDVQTQSGGRISNGYVSDIMSGKQSNPTVNKLMALAAGLGIDVRELFEAAIDLSDESREGVEVEEIDSMALVSLMEKVVRNPRLGTLVHEAAQLPEEEQEVMLKAVRSFNQYHNSQVGNKRSA